MSNYLLSHKRQPGQRPGALDREEVADSSPYRVCRYNEDHLEFDEVKRLADAYTDNPDEVCWLEARSEGAVDRVRELRNHLHWHPLMAEDVLNLGQRPKIEEYGDQIFVIAVKPKWADGHVHFHQFSFVLSPGVLVSLHNGSEDIFEPIRKRLDENRGLIRKPNADYLLYCLLDVIVDHGFIVADFMSEPLTEIEDGIFNNSKQDPIQELHGQKRAAYSCAKLLRLQTIMLEEFVSMPHDLITETTRPYLRDCHDHALRVQESFNSTKDECEALLETYLSLSSHRLNDIMKVLTLISTVFIPLGFLVGLYGMNFDTESAFNMPELGWRFGYLYIWGVITLIVSGQIWFFRKKRWI